MYMVPLSSSTHTLFLGCSPMVTCRCGVPYSIPRQNSCPGLSLMSKPARKTCYSEPGERKVRSGPRLRLCAGQIPRGGCRGRFYTALIRAGQHILLRTWQIWPVLQCWASSSCATKIKWISHAFLNTCFQKNEICLDLGRDDSRSPQLEDTSVSL